MKILQIGCGGVGSYFIEEFCHAMRPGQIDGVIEIVIADNDIVELHQIDYQNFSYTEAGVNKAEALAKRFSEFDVNFVPQRITEKDLKTFDFIVLCVDNDTTRQMVVKHCFEHNKQFLDLRATGRHIAAFPKISPEQNMKFVSSDATCYSCQENKVLIDKGHKIVAVIGVQMFLNYLRGVSNRAISLFV